MSNFLRLPRAALAPLLILLLATVTANIAIHEHYKQSFEGHKNTEEQERVVGIGEATISERPIASRGLIGCIGLILDYGDSAFLGHVRAGKLYEEDAVTFAAKKLGELGRELDACRFAILYSPEPGGTDYDKIVGDLRENGVDKIFTVPYGAKRGEEQRDIIYYPGKNNLVEMEVKAVREYNFKHYIEGHKEPTMILREILPRG